MELDTSALSREEAGALYPTLLTPRPVVLIGTWNAEHSATNLAPYSSVSFVANHPPMLVVSFSQAKGGRQKETLRLATATGELVVNALTRDQADLAARAAESAYAGDSRDDYARLGGERAPFAAYAAGRLMASPTALGCSVENTVELTPSRCVLLIAEVKHIYISDAWQAADSSAATCNGLFASIAAEQYIDLSQAEEFFLPRTWE